VLDIFQEKGAINTVFLTTFTYGRGLSGRQIAGHPYPDHGIQESDNAFYHGGNYATPHAEFYQHTALKQTRAPDHGNVDIVAAVLPAARKRGMKLFCSIEDVWRPDVAGLASLTEVDLQGRRTTSTLCPLHPDVRAFWSDWPPIFASPMISTASSFSTSTTARCWKRSERVTPNESPLPAPRAFCEFHQKSRANAA